MGNWGYDKRRTPWSGGGTYEMAGIKIYEHIHTSTGVPYFLLFCYRSILFSPLPLPLLLLATRHHHNHGRSMASLSLSSSSSYRHLHCRHRAKSKTRSKGLFLGYKNIKLLLVCIRLAHLGNMVRLRPVCTHADSRPCMPPPSLSCHVE